MNFQTLPPVGKIKDFLASGLTKARIHSQKKKQRSGTWQQKLRERERQKWEVLVGDITSRLIRINQRFPRLEELPRFYQMLFAVQEDPFHYHKACAALRWATQQINALHRQQLGKLKTVQDSPAVEKLSRELHGRIASVLKQVHAEGAYLEHCRNILRTFPDIKEIFTVCVYGFPNVGKTTLLNQLTGTQAKIAAYPFTTTSINVGYFRRGTQVIQIADVPGTLNRSEKLNPIEQQAELVVKEVAHVLLFVIDASENSGYTLDLQEMLLQRLREQMQEQKKKIIVYIRGGPMLPFPVPEKKFTSPQALQEYLLLLEKRYQEQKAGDKLQNCGKSVSGHIAT